MLLCTPFSISSAVKAAESSGQKDTGVHEVMRTPHSLALHDNHLHLHHIRQVTLMIKAQTEQGISIHQSLTVAFDPVTILHQSRQLQSHEKPVQREINSILDAARSASASSEHENLHVVKQALEQREKLPSLTSLNGTQRCYGCGMQGHFASSCTEKVSDMFPSRDTLLIQRF